MNKNSIIVGSIIAVVGFAVILFFLPKPSKNTLYPKPSTQKVLFKDSEFAANAYKIAPGPLDENAKSAMDGFDLHTKKLPDGSFEVSLNPLKYGYQAHQSLVKPGYTLYFIESNTDDDTKGFDSALGDDRPVLVDPQGYIIE